MAKEYSILFAFILISSVVFSAEAYAEDDFDILIETGAIWQSRNDVQIPSDSGTRLEVDEFSDGPFYYYRIESYYRINQKHALRLVYAPFEIEVTGRPSEAVVFDGQTFSDSEDLTIRYKFNSYRLSYIYGFWDFGDDQLNLGFTGKVRDAETTLRQSNISESYDNVGFVPLMYFEYQKTLNSNWNFNFNVDFAAAPQGRAVDAALKARYKFREKSSLGVGVRSLEGGADNEKVFAFSWFNYALLELKWSF